MRLLTGTRAAINSPAHGGSRIGAGRPRKSYGALGRRAKFMRVKEVRELIARLEPEAAVQAQLLEDTLCCIDYEKADYIKHTRPSFDEFMAEFRTLPGGHCDLSKATVAAVLAHFMTPSYVSKKAGIPYSTLRDAMVKLAIAEHDEEKAKKKRKREPSAPPPTEKRQNFDAWARIQAPVCSGSTNQRYLKFSTFVDAHRAFEEHCQVSNLESVVLSTFISYCRADRIKRQGWDRYLCPTCCDAKSADARGENMTAEQKAHLKLIPTQWEAWKEDVESLKEDTTKIVVVHDFSTVHESAGFKVRILSICLFYYDDGEVIRDFHDFVSSHKGNWEFVRVAWKKLKLEFQRWNRFKSLVIWSDNGLKNKENLHYFHRWHSTTTKHLEVELKYWAPQHGHSECDRHFGQLKLKLRRSFAGTYIPKDKKAVDVVVKEASEMANTVASNEMDIDTPHEPLIEVKGIRSLYYFIMLSEGQYQCRSDCSKTTGRIVTVIKQK
jgi:hypothetical protein